jgi:FixJ family two-component response regulator
MPETSETVCVLDDDASVRSSIERLLDSDGLSARTFERADDFLAHASQHKVALAVLDVWLPGASGLAVQQRLHRISPGARVIVMTGRDEPGIRAAALAGGAFAFLRKPFDDEAFIALIRRALDPGASYGPKVP